MGCDPLDNVAELLIANLALGIQPTSNIIQRGNPLPTASDTSPWFFIVDSEPDVLWVKLKQTGGTWTYVYLQGAT